jgi:hypothetical protein
MENGLPREKEEKEESRLIITCDFFSFFLLLFCFPSFFFDGPPDDLQRRLYLLELKKWAPVKSNIYWLTDPYLCASREKKTERLSPASGID